MLFYVASAISLAISDTPRSSFIDYAYVCMSVQVIL